MMLLQYDDASMICTYDDMMPYDDGCLIKSLLSDLNQVLALI